MLNASENDDQTAAMRRLIHDLRNMFTVIGMNLDALDGDDRRVQRAQDGVTRGTEMLGALSDLCQVPQKNSRTGIGKPGAVS